jgi:hypothetical protein
MSYFLEHSDLSKSQFRELAGLTRHGRIRLFAGAYSSIKIIPDEIRSDPQRRGQSNSSRFVFDYVLRDAGRVRTFLFVVDDSSAAAGGCESIPFGTWRRHFKGYRLSSPVQFCLFGMPARSPRRKQPPAYRLF